MEHRDAVAEAHAEPPERLRRERDLRHEDARPPPLRQRGFARPDVDLGLAAAGGAVEEDVASTAREQLLDPGERLLLRVRQRRRWSLRRQRARDRGLSPLA